MPIKAAFDQLKSMLSSEVCMAKYDPSYSITVSADASTYGLGAVLVPDQPTGERRAVAYAPRSLKFIEQRYSQTEKKAL
ncbi:MAG: RNase H-like domain-containing protein, partial [Anaplasma sp.]|nr:RNase H-like domain-containing protein [Anaplasma sp.]